jgi:hypothetical protein
MMYIRCADHLRDSTVTFSQCITANEHEIRDAANTLVAWITAAEHHIATSTMTEDISVFTDVLSHMCESHFAHICTFQRKYVTQLARSDVGHTRTLISLPVCIPSHCSFQYECTSCVCYCILGRRPGGQINQDHRPSDFLRAEGV